MNTLREALQEYLALRRGLGFKMHDAGLVLPRFVAFMEQHQALHITTRLALEWVQQAKTVQPAERARRLCFARGFARYRSATDPLTEVPSPELLPYRSTRARPYLYTEQEVLGLLVVGKSADEISAELFVSLATVRTHVRAILRKLGVNSQLAAVVLAQRSGWQPAKM